MLLVEKVLINRVCTHNATARRVASYFSDPKFPHAGFLRPMYNQFVFDSGNN